MKTTLCALFLVAFFLPALSQKKANSRTRASLSSLQSVSLQLIDPDSLPVMRPENLFSSFEVLDERPDTARIGIHSGFKFLRSANKQLVFDRPVKEEITDYFNKHFARPGAPFTALVVLRTLWLSDVNYIREDMVKDPDKRFEKTNIRLRAEVYAVKDKGYMPLFRFDSSQISKKTSYSLWGKDLASLLADLADSASLITARRAGTGRFAQRADVLQYNESRFSLPITTDTVFPKGVYASFEEFRSNTPSICNFEIQKEKNKDILYIKEAGGNSYYSHTAWGYSDGKDIYIMKDGSLHRAWKEGNSFYLLSTIDKYQGPEPASGFSPAGSPATTLTPVVTSTGKTVMIPETTYINPGIHSAGTRIFTVDMDTGDIY